MYAWTITQNESGLTLLAFLRRQELNGLSARAIKRALDSNLCLVNQRPERYGSFILGLGDQVTFLAKEKTISKQGMPHILYEDSSFLIISKPCGISSDNLLNNSTGLALAHRLDKHTTGALIFAKNSHALKGIETLFRQHAIHKSYLAIVWGVPKQPTGIIDNTLGECYRAEGIVKWGEVSPSKGVRAITYWQKEKQNKEIALLRCFPKTGRTHQIRVHLSSLGFPILGDYTYGCPFYAAYPPPRYLLHAETLIFEHPIIGKKIEICAPLPVDFQSALNHLFPEKSP